MISLPPRPLLLVVSAPSGAGKTTLCERLLSEFSDRIAYSVSCTTREPREGEVDGRDYHFLTPEAFEARASRGDFLEHALVHGSRYGTLREEVLRGFAAGRHVLMDLDVQGAAQIRERVAAAAPGDPLRHGMVDIFIAVPSEETLRERLLARGKDRVEVIEARIKRAADEMSHWREYGYLVVNDRLDAAYDALRSIFIAEQRRILPAQKMRAED